MTLDSDRLAQLRLARSDQIGPVTFRQLVRRFGSAGAALSALPELAARGGGRPPRIASVAAVEDEVERLQRLGGRHLFRSDPDYPALLAEVESAPPVLIAIGDPALLRRPAVAIVGARNASAAACRFARSIAHDLGEMGAVIVSGLARGVDTAAHDGSIATGTVAVVAGGVDIFYPPENEPRQRAISERGLLLSERPPGLEPRARHFPHRNRIIAGLSLGTLVVEAAPKSGSLITARNAAEYGREVMAVPGSPLDPRAQGCNLLIREGATLVQSAEDVMEAVQPFRFRLVTDPSPPPPGPTADSAVETGDEDRLALLELLGPTPVAVDELVRQSSLPAAAVASLLLELELAGRLERHAGGRVGLA